MQTIRILIVLGCLALGQRFSLAAEGAVEIAPAALATNATTPDPCVNAGQACDCDNGPLPQRSLPVWYWFHAYRGRQQHYAPPSPIPGNYYFKPYSLVQLRAQQEMIKKLGGDPRNLTGPLPKPANQVVKWPSALLDHRFSEHRDVIESPYLRDPNRPTDPTSEDYQNMIGAVGRMRALLGQVESEIPRADITVAEKFLDRLASQARAQKLMITEEARQAIARGELRSRPDHSNRPSVAPASLHASSAANRAVPANFELTAIQWPAILQRPQFAAQRTLIETPFHGHATRPTVDAYRRMIEAAAQLKVMLEEPGQGISPQECIDAQRFLGRLATEARSQCVMYWNEQPDPSSPNTEAAPEANPYANGGVYQTSGQDAVDGVATLQQIAFDAEPIRWPAALLDDSFESQRAAIEGPFQGKAPKPAGMTAADYENMVQAAELMLKTLISSETKVDAKQRVEAEAFLVQLIKEARDRARDKTKAGSPAAPGIIAWPPALRGPRFAVHRSQIETPFRHENTQRTADDYQTIVSAAAEMKTMLGELQAELAEKAYQDAATFLDQLAAEARERMDAKSAAAAIKQVDDSKASAALTDSDPATHPDQPRE